MRTGAAIEAVGLTKEYRLRGRTVRAVDGLNLSVGAGEFFSLLGVNGAGKTTVIKMLSCLTPPTAGTATLGVRQDSILITVAMISAANRRRCGS